MRPVSVPTREQSVRPMRGARRERRELAFLAGGMGSGSRNRSDRTARWSILWVSCRSRQVRHSAGIDLDLVAIRR